MLPMWLGLCWPTRSFPACSIQIDSAICKSCRGLSEDYQNTSDRPASLSPNSAKLACSRNSSEPSFTSPEYALDGFVARFTLQVGQDQLLQLRTRYSSSLRRS